MANSCRIHSEIFSLPFIFLLQNLQQNSISFIFRIFQGTSLFWATVKGLDDIVELLIWNGANLTSRNRTGCTPLHAACDGNRLEIARFVSLSADICQHTSTAAENFDIIREKPLSPSSLTAANCEKGNSASTMREFAGYPEPVTLRIIENHRLTFARSNRIGKVYSQEKFE